MADELDKDKDEPQASTGQEDASSSDRGPEVPADNGHEEDLGIAGNIAKAFITSPVTVWIVPPVRATGTFWSAAGIIWLLADTVNARIINNIIQTLYICFI